MKVGLAYDQAPGPLPSVEQLYVDLLPRAEMFAYQLHLEDPEGSASGACADVVFVRRYQDRWKPGTATVQDYLYTMVANRLRDALRSQSRRLRWQQQAEAERAPSDYIVTGTTREDPEEAVMLVGRLDERLGAVETLADLERLRGALAEDPFFSELLDVVAGRALADDPLTSTSIRDALTAAVSVDTVRNCRRTLGTLATGYLG